MSTHYTFDQGHIQSDRTGEFLTALDTHARCRAFTGFGLRLHRIRIKPDRSVLVWDSIAGHYTNCHRLSRATQRRIIAKHIL